ncbi:MAG: RNA polymerase sigma factor RpoH [Legionellales bacterium]|nr:RNA polymerase sigma factor RpoH [Legionellales bacterium]
MLAPVGNLTAYIDWTQRIPILTKEEEISLLERLHAEGDMTAAKQLVMSHLRFVVYVSRGYLGYGLSHEDLIQEGNIGLMKALKRFDPTVGVRLVSFAVHWIKSEIQEFVLKNWRIVKVATTKAARKLFFKKHQMKNNMTQEEIGYLSESLSVSKKDVEDMIAKISASGDVCFDPLDHSEASPASPSTYLASPSELSPENAYIQNASQKHDQHQLQIALQQLDARSLDIIQNRWLADDEQKQTLHDLAHTHGVSAERIRQLEQSAMRKLRTHLSAND